MSHHSFTWEARTKDLNSARFVQHWYFFSVQFKLKQNAERLIWSLNRFNSMGSKSETIGLDAFSYHGETHCNNMMMMTLQQIRIHNNRCVTLVWGLKACYTLNNIHRSFRMIKRCYLFSVCMCVGMCVKNKKKTQLHATKTKRNTESEQPFIT